MRGKLEGLVEMPDLYNYLPSLILYHNKKIRQGCGFALHMQRVLDGFIYYNILLDKQDNR